MKKSVLSIVAIAFAAVSVLSSCDKNDDGYGQSAKTETQASVSTQSSADKAQTYNCYACFIDDNMAANATWTAVVSDGTKTAEYDIAAQGKHGSYLLCQEPDMMNVSGYLFTLAQPQSNGKFTVTIKFTPKDKMASLKAEDKQDVKAAKSYFTSTSTNPDFMQQIRATKALGSEGDQLSVVYSSLCKFMSAK